MTLRPPYHVDALSLGHIKPKNTFRWLLGVSETNKIKDKKASKTLFYPVIPPRYTLLRYCKCPSDPQATLPCWCYQVEAISTLKTPSVGSWESGEPINSSLKRLPNPCFIQLFPPKLIPKVQKGFKWTPGHPTKLMLSGVGHINS